MEEFSILRLTAGIVGAYIGNNPVPTALLGSLIKDVHASLVTIAQPREAEPPKAEPAVNPKRSVFPDYIISLEDGRRYKSLKRALMARHSLTPDQYRQKWDLPKDYPMVAPNYSARRSEIAKFTGLGAVKKAAPQAGRKPKV